MSHHTHKLHGIDITFVCMVAIKYIIWLTFFMKDADIAGGAMIITDKRRNAVEFSSPVITTGQQILIQKPTRVELTILFLLHPFTLHVWLLILSVYILTALLIFVINKFSPSEWGSVPEVDDPTCSRDSFSLRNCFWYIHSTMTLQGKIPHEWKYSYLQLEGQAR